MLACKDLIITTESTVDSKVATIDGKSVDRKLFLPNDDHPFDHFLVESAIREKNRKEH